MGKFKGTIINHPAPCETLAFEPSFHRDGVYLQNIYIAPVEDSVSVVSLQNYDNHKTEVTHFWFTAEEIDILVEALLKAKEQIGSNEFMSTA